jgi:prefoldin alpha subunit
MAKARHEVEADLQNLLGVLQQTRDQHEQVRTQAELLRISLDEHRTAIESLEAYRAVEAGHEVLVPVGANAFVHATATADKTAVTELGAGISAAIPIEAAVEKLRARIEKIEASRKRTLETGARLEQSMEALDQQVQGLYGQLSAGEGAAPARGQGARQSRHRAAADDEEDDD